MPFGHNALVISLPRHPTRRARFEAHNGNVGLAWTWIDGVAPDELNAHAFEVQPGYRDRFRNRAITEGEIGCYLAHKRAWKHAADHLPDETVLFLEDDVTLYRNAVPQLTTRLDALKHIPWDLLYLARKPLEDDVGPGPVDGTVVPGQSFWASAYALSPNGIKKLLDRPDPVIPVDELFCRLSDLYVLSLDPLCAAPRMDSWIESATEISPGWITKSQVLVFAVATDPNHEGFTTLTDSAQVYGVRVHHLGDGETWTPPLKLRLWREALHDLPPTQIVLFLDGYDVFFNDAVDHLPAALDRHECDVLFAAETGCWPDAEVAEQYPPTDSPFRFLNSGGVLARAGVLKTLLEDVKDVVDDQAACTRQFLHHRQRYNIKLDVCCTVFQTLHGVHAADIQIDVNRSIYETLSSVPDPPSSTPTGASTSRSPVLASATTPNGPTSTVPSSPGPRATNRSDRTHRRHGAQQSTLPESYARIPQTPHLPARSTRPVL